VHIVAPQVWAYRPGRAATLHRFVDHLLLLLPFEPPFFARYGLACTFVGHPMIEEGIGSADGLAFRARNGIAPDAPLLVVLPGSRRNETSRLLPVYLETVARVARAVPSLRAVLPAVPHLAGAIREAVKARGGAITVVEGRDEKLGAFAAGTVALAASGSVTLELALAGLPMVVGYRMNPLTAAIARRLVRVPFITLANLTGHHSTPG
jgi:lipid-A-disaccharide synthase